LAGGQTISEWARDVLLKATQPTTAEQIILAEVVALRTILLNAFYMLAQGERLTADEMQQLIERADRDKLRKAQERLAATAIGGAQ
jgi:predicted PurR-regulated permease PerM